MTETIITATSLVGLIFWLLWELFLSGSARRRRSQKIRNRVVGELDEARKAVLIAQDCH